MTNMNRWSALIIRALFTRLDSFQTIQKDTQMATNILSERVQILQDKDIITKAKLPQNRHMKYLLTKKGRDICPILLALMEWGDTWYKDSYDQPLTHKPCGNPLVMQVACSACDGILLPQEVTYKLERTL